MSDEGVPKSVKGKLPVLVACMILAACLPPMLGADTATEILRESARFKTGCQPVLRGNAVSATRAKYSRALEVLKQLRERIRTPPQ